MKRPLVPVEPVVEHVRALQAAGVSRARIAEAARVSEATLDRVVRQPGTRMRGDLASRILRVRLAVPA